MEVSAGQGTGRLLIVAGEGETGGHDFVDSWLSVEL